MSSTLDQLPQVTAGQQAGSYEAAEVILRGLAEIPASARGRGVDHPILPDEAPAARTQPADAKLRLAEVRYRTLV